MTFREFRIALMLLATMAMSTLVFFELIVLASEVERDLGISKFQIGMLGAVNTGVAGVFGVQAGTLCDRLGGRRAMGMVLLIAVSTAIFLALSRGYIGLLVGMALAGFAQGLGNPSTNRVIAESISEGARGLVTGIKQSGVQVAVFSTGFAMPAIASRWGWRSGLWIAAGLGVVAFVGLLAVPEGAAEESTGPDDGENQSRDSQARDSQKSSDRQDVIGNPDGRSLPPFVYQVGLYGFLLGCVGGGIGRFVPLFAEEVVAMSTFEAGAVFGIAGVVAVVARVISGILLDRGVPARGMLFTLGLGGAMSLVLMVLADPGPTILVWVGSVLGGLTLSTWNTAANLAMVRQGPLAGRASGVLVVGFMLGLTVSGPLVGLSIDQLDTYTPAFVVSACLAVAGAAAIWPRLGTDATPPS